MVPTAKHAERYDQRSQSTLNEPSSKRAKPGHVIKHGPDLAMIPNIVLPAPCGYFDVAEVFKPV